MMPEQRPPLAPSLSFSGSSSTSTVSRPLKRRNTSTSDLTFFTSAATSFKPLPYNPNVPGLPPPKPPPPRNNHTRTVESLALPSPVMDPSPMDPNCVFIHPPFTSFPGSENYPDGLYYPLMAANPEWFLDPNDFISAKSMNPNAIPYPPHLEPPRGWCPAKKRDLKERGVDGWPEGEEPRLRCTFCRRTYAGVNAKSMWRRHVFEKHKIAMSNRRDGNERPRGRGSSKENRQLSSVQHNDECHDNLLNMDVVPQISPVLLGTHKSKFRSLLPADEVDTKSCGKPALGDSKVNLPSTPRIPRKKLPSIFLSPSSTRPHPLSQSTLPPISPPLTPTLHSSDAPLISESSPVQPMPVVPPSPYDPLLTPSFRHSPPRLPSDQPWRFPSPSHPLHSSAHELCLTMLAPSGISPVNKEHSTTGSSPGGIVQGTPLQSPSVIALFRRHKTYNLDPDTPESIEKLPRPSPRTLFSKSRLPFPVTDRMNPDHDRSVMEDSPVSHNLRRTARSRSHRKRPVSESSDDWFSSGSPSSVSRLAEVDPFAVTYTSWGSESEILRRNCSSPISTVGGESPVLRSNVLPSNVGANGSALVGLGIGLMEPFSLPHEDETDFDGIYSELNEEEGDEAEVAIVLGVSNGKRRLSPRTPHLNKRRRKVG